MVKKLPACRRPEFDPGLGRSPGGGSLVFLPGEFQGQRILVGYSPWDPKEFNMTERLMFSHIHYSEFKNQNGIWFHCFCF